MPTIDITNLTLNPEEVTSFAAFVYERTFKRPNLNRLHPVFSGVKMKEQIVFASLMGLSGLKSDGSCDRKSSGVKSILTQKYWDPQGIEDTLINCQKDIDSLFKAYSSKMKKYLDEYNFTGSEQERFLAIMFEETITPLIWRAAWFGNKSAAIATAGTSGLKNVDLIPFFDYIDGFWVQIFEAVTAGDVKRYEIAENLLTTPAAQTTLSAGRYIDFFDGVFYIADDILKDDPR